MLTSLAEQKPQLLQPRVKRILGSHCVGGEKLDTGVNWGVVDLRSTA